MDMDFSFLEGYGHRVIHWGSALFFQRMSLQKP